MVFIEVKQIAMRQQRNLGGITTTIEVISGLREQMKLQALPCLTSTRTHVALHFIEDDAAIDERTFRIIGTFKLHSVPFLSEIQRVQRWKEHGVQINRQ